MQVCKKERNSKKTACTLQLKWIKLLCQNYNFYVKETKEKTKQILNSFQLFLKLKVERLCIHHEIESKKFDRNDKFNKNFVYKLNINKIFKR